jgi:hypothetical protein
MNIVIRDPETLAQIQSVTTAAELRDAAGHRIGLFTPYRANEPQLSEEEWRRIEQEPGGRSLAEILADLEKRA